MADHKYPLQQEEILKQLYVEIGSMMGEFKNFKEQIDRLLKIIHGNGNRSIPTALAVLQEQMENMEKSLEESKLLKKALWAALITGALGLVGAAINLLIQSLR